MGLWNESVRSGTQVGLSQIERRELTDGLAVDRIAL